MMSPALPMPSSESQFFTDASEWGFGGYFRGEYFFGPWSEYERQSLHINQRELLAVLFAVETFSVYVVFTFSLAVTMTLPFTPSLTTPRATHLLRQFCASYTSPNAFTA